MNNKNGNKKLFGHLKREVIDSGFCVSCGACVVSCPLHSLGFEETGPELQGMCNACGLCYAQCPQPVFDDDLKKRIFGDNPSSAIGYYKGLYSGKTTSPEIEMIAQNGGVVTSLLVSLLEEGFIDGAVVMDKDSQWKPIPMVATTKEELLDCSGSKYSQAPILKALGDVVDRYDMDRVALVGTPCQIKAFRNMTVGDRPAKKVSKSVLLTVGLFCLRSFAYESLFEKVLPDQLGIDPSDVSKFDITESNLVIYQKGRPKKRVSLDVLERFVPESCKVCGDFTAEFADISVGGTGSPEGFSTTIVRTDVGSQAFSVGLKSGGYEVNKLDEDEPRIESIEKLSKINKQKAERRIKIQTRNDESLPSGLLP